ncbi:hypothetical protein B9Z55_013665 [Caenorhabditis nigoni]|uniref:CCHC-type domain-containing protein n=1 Tax=Caenorhabditis nigoni TaxID=1611254 RepID=A0A2G5U2R0_9PELO|nr:hypothetical protein B9Z55_013665 [Caenorhabditis nigoni]
MDISKELEDQLLGEPPAFPKASVTAKGNQAAQQAPEAEQPYIGKDALELAQQIKEHLDAKRGDLVTYEMIEKIHEVGGLEIYQKTMEFVSSQGIPTALETTILRKIIRQAADREAKMRAQHKDHLQLLDDKIDSLASEVTKLREQSAKLENQLKTGRAPRTKKCVLQADEKEGCKICAQLDHPASRCHVYPTAEAKISALQIKNACLVCARTGHGPSECPAASVTKECSKCKLKHFRALCIPRFGAAAMDRKKREAEEQKQKKQAKVQATLLAGITSFAQPPTKNNQKRKWRKKMMKEMTAGGKEE